MRKRMALSLGAIIGTAVAVSGTLTALGPFESARAGPSATSNQPDVQAVMKRMAAGSRIELQEDGSVSFFGGPTPEAAAEDRRVAELSQVGPESIRCKGEGAAVTCVAVPDPDVIPALKAGQRLYGRTIYYGISREAIAQGKPFLESGTLVCDSVTATLSCTRVEKVQPTIPQHESVFVAYVPYNVTFDERGAPVIHRVARPTVPLALATNND